MSYTARSEPWDKEEGKFHSEATGTWMDGPDVTTTLTKAFDIIRYWTCGQNNGGIQSRLVTRKGNLRHIPERRIAKQAIGTGRLGSSSSSASPVKAESIGDKLPERAVRRKPSKKALRYEHLNVSTVESSTACPQDSGHAVMCQTGGAVLLAGPPSCPLRQVSSPAYPTAYPANRHCNVTLKSQGFALRLWFSFFQLEEGHDWLQISEEGSSKQVRQMQTSSGRDIPPSFLAGTGQVTLLFHSDEDVEEGGFVLHYESIVAPPSKTDGLLTGACPRQAVLLADAAGSITSPQGYDHKLKCRWRIQAENDKTLVRLHVSHATMVAPHDSLTITTDREIIPVIGQPDSDLTLYSLSRASVEFVSHSLSAASAFRIDYDVIRQSWLACGLPFVWPGTV
ncbi:hypothetical protein RvY_17086 [Ramazzottius varieornatus]|uniref:CUB domain-containing protein n=1 Tax=Ramazzottius varieornatus TaxID=947166 RepID=A0A1D1W4X6_RAMVA|nr:hypothetical protein RvY_17086 [Ramazzottius varieornatus]